MQISRSKAHWGHEGEFPHDEYLFTFYGSEGEYDVYHSKSDSLFVARYSSDADSYHTDEYNIDISTADSDEVRAVFAIAYQEYFGAPHPAFESLYKKPLIIMSKDPSVSPNSKSIAIPKYTDAV